MLIELAARLGATPLSVAIQSSTWLTPLLQAVHILVIGIVFVSMLMIALRVLGLVHTEDSFDATWRRFAPWMWRGLVVMVLTGVTLLIGEPERQVGALSFWLKMLILAVAVACVLALRRALAGGATHFGSGARLGAAAIVMLWVLIIFLGRAIAYDVEVWGSLSPAGHS